MIEQIQGIILLGLALLLSGCSTFYYGYSKEEWESLTKLEQERAKHAYKDVRYAHQQNIYGAPADDASKAFVERALKSTNDSPR